MQSDVLSLAHHWKCLTVERRLLYEIQEVSAKLGLSPITVRNYLRAGQSDLVRGRDFIVWRINSAKRRYRITEYGLERLTLGHYSTRRWHPGARQAEEKPRDTYHPRLRLTGPRSERIGQLRAVLYDALWRYQETPCAQPGCPCVIHKLGVPQAEVVQIIMKRDGYVDALGKFHRYQDATYKGYVRKAER
jgi:hypothetical protein